MDSDLFHVGDVVKMKGQPNVSMTISAINVVSNDYKSVTCMWFDNNDNLNSEEFDVNILSLVL